MSEPKFKPGDIVEVVQDTTCHGSPNGTRLTIQSSSVDSEPVYYYVEEDRFCYYEHDFKLISTAEQTEEATPMTKQVGLKDEYRIKTESPLERRMVMAALMEAGFVWQTSKQKTSKELESDWPQQTWPTIKVSILTKKLDFYRGSMEAEDTLADVLKAIAPAPPKPIEIKLNSNHTATVTSSEVKVGCQTFSFAVIEQLAEAVVKMKEAAA